MENVGDFEYNAKDLIGHGAFAVVFKGRHKKNPNATVAIKSITKKNLSKSHNLLGKEIKILKELAEVHHENIVALLDCKETQHHVFLVMEYCNGGDLADYLSVKGTLSEDTIRSFLKQLAGAMRALQLKGIVHRDLKPQNILLSHAGKPNPQPSDIRLKIADFGFARFLQDGVMAATLCGSPMYMAPEVIMSLQYDAKADLWSLGTIVFQCLTGRAPFTAQTPQALKMFYERNQNPSPKIPPGTSTELTALLHGLLRRNAKDRMEFDDFFNHVFIRKNENPVPISSTAPVAIGRSPPVPVPTPVLSTPPTQNPLGSAQQQNNNAPTPEEADDFVLVPSPSQQRTLTTGFNGNEALSETGGVVSDVVGGGVNSSQPIPVPSQRNAFLKLQASQRNGEVSPLSSPSLSPGAAAAALGSLPRSQPISVALATGSDRNQSQKAAVNLAGDINSLSPPSVQFCVGTPPSAGIAIGMGMGYGMGSRRRSTSGSSCCSGTSPPPFSASPWPQIGTSSPLRRTGSNNFNPSSVTAAPSGSLAPIMGSPSKAIHAGPAAWTHPSRAMTLPELTCGNVGHSPSVTICSSTGVHRSQTDIAFGISSSPGNRSPGCLSGSNWSLQRKPSLDQHLSGVGGAYAFGTSPPQMEGPIVFVAPELAQETLMEKEHNDTLAKLNFVLALVECIVEVARSRASPLAAALSESTYSNRSNTKLSTSPTAVPSAGGRDGPESPSTGAVTEAQRRAEQLVLYVRALQLLSSALNLSKEELQAERLHASSSVKQVVSMLNQRFHHCLSQCKQLHAQSLSRDTQILVAGDSVTAQLTADKLLYNHAIELCQSAALDELFGNPATCCRRYQTAHILFHSLAQQVTLHSDKTILNKYKEAVEKRLFVLQQQGYIYAFDTA